MNALTVNIDECINREVTGSRQRRPRSRSQHHCSCDKHYYYAPDQKATPSLIMTGLVSPAVRSYTRSMAEGGGEVYRPGGVYLYFRVECFSEGWLPLFT
jgi:hypothetical protein